MKVVLFAMRGFDIILTGAGVAWSHLNCPASIDDDLTMMHVMLMLLLDSVIYAIIAWYMEAVFPGDFGIPQSWYFPIQVCFCFSALTPTNGIRKVRKVNGYKLRIVVVFIC